MSYEDSFRLIVDERARANRLAREVLKMAKEQKISVPILVGSLVNEYACDCEASVEREMSQW